MSEPALVLSPPAARALAELGRLDPDADISAAVRRLVALAQQVLPDTVAVSITVRHQGEAFTFAASAPLAEDLDERQYDAGEGPCTDALATGVATESPDLGEEQRWPGWTPVAVAAGVASMRSAPLISAQGRHLGALNCYGSTPAGYTRPGARQLGDLLATHTSTLVQNLTVLDAARAVAAQLGEAMTSRATIEQAKGVLMSRLGISSELAFDYLTKLSQTSHRKLRDVATGVITHASQGPGTDHRTGTWDA